MNKRQKIILKYLLSNKNKYSTSSELAKLCSCSMRTIRNDIYKIEELLSKSNIGLDKKPGSGVKVIGDNIIIENYLNEISSINENEIYSENTRKYHILLLLLMNKKPLCLDYLSEKFYIPKNTIRNDIDKIEHLVKKYDLKLEIKTGVGIYILGNEINKRNLLSYTSKKLELKENYKKELHELFDAEEIELVNNSISLLSDSFKENIEHNPINSITLHILFMIKRIDNNQTVEISDDELKLIKDSPAIYEANKIAKYLEEHLGINFNNNEIAYLALRLNCLYKDACIDNNTSNIMADELVNILMNEVSDLYSVNLRDDEILNNNLKTHMYCTLKRIMSGFTISNPLINDIKREFTQIFLVLQVILDEYMQKYDLKFPEEEIGYIAVHFKAAMERLPNESKTFNTAIVCTYGVGVAAFIEAKLLNNFSNINVLHIMSANEFKSYNKLEDLDFILTTIELGEIPNVNIINISPLLEKTDIRNIKYLINELSSTKTKIIDFNISKYSNPFLIYVDRKEKSKDSLLAYMLSELEKNNYVMKDLFRESVISREKSSNTSIGQFIAIPHGNPDFVINSCISFAIIKDSIFWGDTNVKLVILLALGKDALRKKEIKKFFTLINAINSNTELMEQLSKEKDKLKVLEYFSRYEI